MLGEKIRKIIYWTLDLLKGRKIRKEYLDIKSMIEQHKQNEEALEKILKYSTENIPFYKNINHKSICNFPVMNKAIYNENKDKLENKLYKDKKLHTVLTSGSTGMPFKAVQNNEKRTRTVAALLYFHDKVGFSLGKKYIFLRALSNFNKTSKLKCFMQNYKPFQIVGMDKKRLEELEKILSKNKIKVMLGYGSTLKEVADFLYDNGKNYKLDVILSGGDNLTDETKEKLKKIFKCPVINRYSNEENGMMATTLPNDDRFILNTANYYFELLKLDSDEQVKPGEIGRIVLTDLYNYAMPLIRWDTGDLGVSDDLDRNKLKTLRTLEGRTSDMLEDENGNRLSLVTINLFVHDFFDVKKFQFLQDDEKVLFKVVPKDNEKKLNPSEQERYIKELKNILGESTKIEIQVVEDILPEENGKFKPIINKKTKSNEFINNV